MKWLRNKLTLTPTDGRRTDDGQKAILIISARELAELKIEKREIQKKKNTSLEFHKACFGQISR